MASKDLIEILPRSTDIIVVSSMFNSCMVTTSQLDAYFSMLGIFNSIKKEDLSETPFYFLINWLEYIKTSNSLNIKGLSTKLKELEPDTSAHIEKLKIYFVNLNHALDAELDRLNTLQKGAKKVNKR